MMPSPVCKAFCAPQCLVLQPFHDHLGLAQKLAEKAGAKAKNMQKEHQVPAGMDVACHEIMKAVPGFSSMLRT